MCKFFTHNRKGALGRDFPNFLGFCSAFKKRQQQLAVAVARHKAKREKESSMLFNSLKWNGTDAF